MKKINIIVIGLLLLSMLFACSDAQKSQTIEASKNNLNPSFTFEYDKEGVSFSGSLSNSTDNIIEPFLLELYITFDDGNEYLAMKKNINSLQPSESIKINEDITKVYRDNGFNSSDNKSYRLEIINQK